MASIIPPEFFGLSGLGSSLQSIGQDRQFKQERKRAKSREDLELELALNPNNRQAILQSAEDSGLLPPGSAANYKPTPMERFREVGWDALLEPERLEVGPQLGLAPGETPTLASRGAVAHVRGAEQGVELGDVQLREARAAETRRTQFEESLNTPWFRKMAGLPDDADITPGSLEAISLGQQLTGENLNNMIREARARNAPEREVAELNLIRAQTNRMNAEITRLQREEQVDDGTAEWLKAMSQKTGWMPAQINAAMDPESGIPDSARNAIIRDVGQYQESLRSDVRRAIRESNSEAVQRFQTLHQMHVDGLGVLDPNSPIWFEVAAEALEELGIPAAVVMRSRLFRSDRPSLVTGSEAEAVKSAMEQVGDLLGDTREAPSIDSQTAAVYAQEMVTQFGGVNEARRRLTENSAIPEADRRLFEQALSEIGGSTPEPEAAPAPTGPEPVDDPQTAEEWDQQIAYLQFREKAERQEQISVPVRDRDLTTLRAIRDDLAAARMERRRIRAGEAVQRREEQRRPPTTPIR